MTNALWFFVMNCCCSNLELKKKLPPRAKNYHKTSSTMHKIPSLKLLVRGVQENTPSPPKKTQ